MFEIIDKVLSLGTFTLKYRQPQSMRRELPGLKKQQDKAVAVTSGERLM